MQGVLLRRVVQPDNRLSRFLAERSSDLVDGTTLHNHDPVLGPLTPVEAHVTPCAYGSDNQRQPIARGCGRELDRDRGFNMR